MIPTHQAAHNSYAHHWLWATITLLIGMGATTTYFLYFHYLIPRYKVLFDWVPTPAIFSFPYLLALIAIRTRKLSKYEKVMLFVITVLAWFQTALLLGELDNCWDPIHDPTSKLNTGQYFQPLVLIIYVIIPTYCLQLLLVGVLIVLWLIKKFDKCVHCTIKDC